MAREDDGFFRKGENFFADPGEKLIPIAAGQIPAAHAIREEDIPSVELSGGGQIKAQAARTVARHEKQFGARPPGGKRTGLPEELGGTNRAKALGQAEGEHGVGLQAKKGGVGMVVHGTTSPLREIGGVPDVIPMAVGKKKRIGFEVFLFQKVKEALWCVDGETVAAEIDQVGIGGGEAAGVGQRLKHGNSSFKLEESED